MNSDVNSIVKVEQSALKAFSNLQTISESNKMNSILAKKLLSNKCHFDKYMQKIITINSLTDTKTECFITPVVTVSRRKILFITKKIENNWGELQTDIGWVISDLASKNNYKPSEYVMILHAYFGLINIEQFYEIKNDKAHTLKKLDENELEKILR